LKSGELSPNKDGAKQGREDGSDQSVINPPQTASGIPVHCAFDRLVDLVELVPNPRNTNKHGDSRSNC
jgi:hypothetical protein